MHSNDFFKCVFNVSFGVFYIFSPCRAFKSTFRGFLGPPTSLVSSKQVVRWSPELKKIGLDYCIVHFRRHPPGELCAPAAGAIICFCRCQKSQNVFYVYVMFFMFLIGPRGRRAPPGPNFLSPLRWVD